MRAVIGSDGDALCESCHRAAAEAERARGNAAGRAHSMPRSRHASASASGGGGGGGGLTMSVDAGSCPRCGDKVFEAEKMSSGGRVYHMVSFLTIACRLAQQDLVQIRN